MVGLLGDAGALALMDAGIAIGEIYSALADADAYTVQSRGEQLLLGLGFTLDQMQQSLSGALEVSPMSAVFTDSPQAELGKLAQRYVEPNRHGIDETREVCGRRGREVLPRAVRGLLQQGDFGRCKSERFA